ncbi:MAG TPA: inositol 2-dehydrogenase, partial [Geodermatophilus sp.]|nr:inositol 2-dehydrogenase [Geodermatophilus sp.]
MTATEVLSAVPGAEAATADLRVAVLGVGLMGADHVTRLSRRISGARVAVVSDAAADRADQAAADV